MKLYVLPIELACDAKCSFCITKSREQKGKTLKLEGLAKNLSLEVEKIEITGGGEPTLHPQINDIINICTARAPTLMYTHGAHLRRLDSPEKLTELALSVAHYNPEENHRIMGVHPDLKALQEINVKKKFSLLLHRNGINEQSEVWNYIDWSRKYVEKVVIRQLFEHNYRKDMSEEHISSQRIFESLKEKGDRFGETKQGNPLMYIGNLEVEFELRNCACEMNNPVLHADGKLYKGWSTEPYDINRN